MRLQLDAAVLNAVGAILQRCAIMADDDDTPAETRHMALPVGIDVDGALEIELEFPIDGKTVQVPVTITPDARVGDLTRHIMDKFQLPEYLESTVFSLLQQQIAAHGFGCLRMRMC